VKKKKRPKRKSVGKKGESRKKEHKEGNKLKLGYSEGKRSEKGNVIKKEERRRTRVTSNGQNAKNVL